MILFHNSLNIEQRIAFIISCNLPVNTLHCTIIEEGVSIKSITVTAGFEIKIITIALAHVTSSVAASHVIICRVRENIRGKM